MIETKVQAVQYLVENPQENTGDSQYARRLLLKQPVMGAPLVDQPSLNDLSSVFSGLEGYTVVRSGTERKDQETLSVSFLDTEKRLSLTGEVVDDMVSVVQTVTFNNEGLPIRMVVKRDPNQTAMPDTRLEMAYAAEDAGTEGGNVKATYLREIRHYFDIAGQEHPIQDIAFRTPAELSAARLTDPEARWGQAKPQEVLGNIFAMMPNVDVTKNAEAIGKVDAIFRNPNDYPYMRITGSLEKGEVVVPLFARGPISPVITQPEIWRFVIESGRIVQSNYHFATDMTPHELAISTDPTGESIAGLYAAKIRSDYEYDGNGLLTRRTIIDLADQTKHVSTYTRMSDGTVKTDTVEYDAEGNVVE